MTTLKDHAETLEEAARIVYACFESCKLYETLRSIAADLRARDEAEKRMCDMATGRDTGDTQPAPAVCDIDNVPISDDEQSRLYEFCKGTPHYDVIRKLYRAAHRHVNAAPAVGETPYQMLSPGIRKQIERECEDAEHPKGMSVRDGRTRIHASTIRLLLAHYDAVCAALAAQERKE